MHVIPVQLVRISALNPMELEDYSKLELPQLRRVSSLAVMMRRSIPEQFTSSSFAISHFLKSAVSTQFFWFSEIIAVSFETRGSKSGSVDAQIVDMLLF